MAHRVAPEAAAELDDVWYYIVRESGSIERANKQVDAITERFYLLSTHPYSGRKRDDLYQSAKTLTLVFIRRVQSALGLHHAANQAGCQRVVLVVQSQSGLHPTPVGHALRRLVLRPGLRSFAVGDDVIIYRVTAADDVLILHVLHGRQDLPQIIGPL